MREKLYIKYEQDLSGYWIIMSQNPLMGYKALLGLLLDSFNPYYDWIFVDKGDDEVFITQHFAGDSEDEDVVIKLSLKNYNYIAHQWDKVIEQKPKFFMLSRDDSGWIDLELKNQLSEEDQKYLDQDALKKLT